MASDRAAWVPDLEKYLKRVWSAGSVRITEATPFGGGHSGFTYLVAMSGGPCPGRHVLRLSPPNVRIAGPTDVGRQGQIMRALHDAGLPVPEVLAADSGPVVDGRSFALTRLVRGVTVDETIGHEPPGRVARAAIAFLHRLRDLDASKTGIGDEPPVTLEAECTRWAQLLERADPDLAGSARGFIEQLGAHVPPEETPSLVHGDYHYGNLLFSGAEVVAVVDWEIAQIGEPLMDLGSLAVASLRKRYGDPVPTGNVEIGTADLARLYGSPLERATWIIALSCLKYAAILAYNLRLHRTGRRYDPVYEGFTTTIGRLVEDGARILEHGLNGL